MKILYVDMDNVLVDFPSGIAKLPESTVSDFEGRLDEVPGIFSLMDPIPKAIESFETLAKHYDTYILSTAPWGNPSAWIDKVLWVQKYLGKPAYKRLIISNDKSLFSGKALIDDRLKYGVTKFNGEHIHFGSEKFPNWESVLKYLI